MIQSIRRWLDATLVRVARALLRLTLQSPKRATVTTADTFLRDMAPTLESLTNPLNVNADGLRDLLRHLLVKTLPEEAGSLVPSLARREAPVPNTWVYQNEFMEWNIPADARVLDIGSGGWPFKHATVLADRHIGSTTHRTEQIVRDKRPFFEEDLQKLSFSDKSFDFIFCSHVLEHMDNPGVAMRELMRVGRSGYIEVPTRMSDVMFNFTRIPHHHRWHGLALGTTLILIEWLDQERRDLGNEFFDALQSSYSNTFQDFFERNRDLFFSSFNWRGSFDFIIINKEGKVIDSSTRGTS